MQKKSMRTAAMAVAAGAVVIGGLAAATPAQAAALSVTSPHGQITETKPTFAGEGEAGANVVVSTGSGDTVCTATVASDSTWSCVSGIDIAPGAYTFKVTQTSGSETSIDFSVVQVVDTPLVDPAVAAGLGGLAAIAAGAVALMRRRRTVGACS
jgi:hypothetical protein